MRKILPGFWIVCAVVLVYGNTLQHSFHFDDIPSILEKPWIRGLDKIPDFIFSWWQRPVTILTFNLNHAISGFDVWSYHLVNIALHAAAALGVYLLTGTLLTAFFGAGALPGGVWRGLPLLAGMLFALHPLNTQSVTYISSRSSVLATCFYLAALVLFFRGKIRMRENPGSGRFAGRFVAACGCFLLGALSKQIVWTLPAVGCLLHYYFFSARPFPFWLKQQARWIAALGLPVAGFIGWKQFFGGGLAAASDTPLSPSAYFLTQTFVIPFEYFRKLLFPFNLNIDIHFPILSDWSAPFHWLGIGVLGAYVFGIVRLSRRQQNPSVGNNLPPGQAGICFVRTSLAFSAAWVLITLLPTSSFLPLLDVAVEHRTYLPMAGFSLGAAVFFCFLWNAVAPFEAPAEGKRLAAIPALAVGCVLLLFAVGVVKRNAVWKDEVSLWSDAQKKSPRLIRPYNNLGEAYDKLGVYEAAIAQFEAALKLDPRYIFALNNLGNIYGKTKNYPKAIAYFEKALKEKPDYSPAWYNLARALHLTGKPNQALAAYRKAVAADPYFEAAYYNLAQLSLQSGLIDASIENYSHFLKLRPDHSRARFGLANAYNMAGRFDAARAEFEAAARLDPEFLLPHVGIANLQLQTGDVDAALATYAAILTRKPEVAGLHKNLGMIYLRFKNDTQKALFHFRESLRLEPAQSQAAQLQAIVAELAQTSGESS